MKKLLAVLTVLGVFAIGAGAASAKTSTLTLPSAVHCVGGETKAIENDSLVHIGINVLYDLAARSEPGGYWTYTWVGEGRHKELVKDQFITVTIGACPVASAYVPEPTRVAYCSVAGDTWPDGTPIPAGTFLNLLAGQAATDAHYTGATPAFWVDGVGLTCSLNPAQAALAAASTTLVGGGGTPFSAGLGGIYTFIPSK